MAQKRSAPQDLRQEPKAAHLPCKKAKLAQDTSQRPGSQRSVPTIKWVLPSSSENGRELQQRFAKAVFGEDGGAVHPFRFQEPQLPSPSPRGRTGVKTAWLRNAFREVEGTASLRRLYHLIERNSDDTGPSRRALRRALQGLPSGGALLAHLQTPSLECSQPFAVHILDGNHRVVVESSEIGDHQRQEIQMCRIMSADQEARYFIRVPSGRTATVNGTIFGDGHQKSALCIGPLTAFAIIEVLGQAIFFWADRGSIRSASRALTEEERSAKRRAVQTSAAAALVACEALAAASKPDARLEHDSSKETAPEGDARDTAVIGTEFGCELYDDTVTMAISAVVEAVARHQADSGPLSGFSMCSSVQALCARSGIPSFVSRPRRCLLLPTVIGSSAERSGADESGGHFLLSILQEEAVEGQAVHRFQRYLLDSAPHYSRVEYPAIANELVTTAQNLGWSTQRNGDGHVRFAPTVRLVPVALQTDKWTCGLHTILNAWACAMGLTLDADCARLGAEHRFARKAMALVNEALAGQTDWMQLVTFLQAYEYVVETSPHDVPEDRRFSASVRQTNETALEERTAALADQDTAILLPENLDDVATPYDLRNNVAFRRWESFTAWLT